jgi:hypothetical protein
MKAASALYLSETKRGEVLSPLLSDILGVHIQMVTDSDRTRLDGIVEFPSEDLGDIHDAFDGIQKRVWRQVDTSTQGGWVMHKRGVSPK